MLFELDFFDSFFINAFFSMSDSYKAVVLDKKKIKINSTRQHPIQQNTIKFTHAKKNIQPAIDLVDPSHKKKKNGKQD